MKFKEWYKELKELAKLSDFTLSPDTNAWKELYKEGLSPEDAFDCELEAVENFT